MHIFVGQYEVKNELSETPFKMGNVELGVAQIEDGLFKCLDCPKTFQHLSTAKRHYNEKHIMGPQKCAYCGKKYNALRYLKEHLFNKHQITSDTSDSMLNLRLHSTNE